MLSEFIILEKNDSKPVPENGKLNLSAKIPDISNEDEDAWFSCGKVIVTFSNKFITNISINLNNRFKKEIINEYPYLIKSANFNSEIINTILLHIYWVLSINIIDNVFISFSFDNTVFKYDYNPEFKSLNLIEQ
jgi:hypothetical protein